MKIILSRKGFDTGTGKIPSPIYDGKLLSFPIPHSDSDIRYKDIKFDLRNSYLDVLIDLNKKFIPREAHLDPDIRTSAYKRENGWRGLFGQSGAAGTLLKDIKEGDLFLFFGLFQFVTNTKNEFKYDYSKALNKKGQHIIFGYLQVGERIDLDDSLQTIPLWSAYHPHVKKRMNMKKNTLFVANDKLDFSSNRPGWGTFKYHKNLALTKEGENMSVWELPGFFKKEEKNFSKSFGLKRCEALDNGNILMERYGQSQEVFISESPCVQEWAKKLIMNNQTFS